MKKLKGCLTLGLMVMLGVAFAADIPWTYDSSKRPGETKSVISSSVAALHSGISRVGSAVRDLDSCFLSWERSEARGLNSLPPKGLVVFVR